MGCNRVGSTGRTRNLDLRRSFTLLELIVAVIVLAVLSIFAVPTYESLGKASGLARDEANLAALSRDALALARQTGASLPSSANFSAALADQPTVAGATKATSVSASSNYSSYWVNGSITPGQLDVDTTSSATSVGLAMQTNNGSCVTALVTASTVTAFGWTTNLGSACLGTIALAGPAQPQPSPQISATFSLYAGSTSVSGWADGTAAARFSRPMGGIVFDSSGNAYVADSNNNMIRKIDPAGNVTTIAGNGVAGLVNGTGTFTEFNNPAGLTLSPDQKTLYVADRSNHVVRAITLATNAITTLAGSGALGAANANGTSASFRNVYGIVTDPSGNIYVADGGNNLIRKIDTSANVTTLAGRGLSFSGFVDSTGSGAQFNNPEGLAISPSGATLYVVDNGNNAIRSVTTAGGVVSTVAGSGAAGMTNGTGAQATFNAPIGIALDSSGNLYVSDQTTSTPAIRRITPAGLVTTFPAPSFIYYYLAFYNHQLYFTSWGFISYLSSTSF